MRKQQYCVQDGCFAPSCPCYDDDDQDELLQGLPKACVVVASLLSVHTAMRKFRHRWIQLSLYGKGCRMFPAGGPPSACPARVSGGKVSFRAAGYCKSLFRVGWRADYGTGQPIRRGIQALGAGQQTTTARRNGCRVQRMRALIRAMPSSPTLFHLHGVLAEHRGHDADAALELHCSCGLEHRVPQIRRWVPLLAATRPTVLDAQVEPTATAYQSFVRQAPVLETPVMLYWGAMAPDPYMRCEAQRWVRAL
ncbi:hypothetical protein DE146DRAFT_628128 [Phaeosphaeria sp. MPI-PUGE-AT-0046c]|nr:hypothetical protein DE146DRAFT_628128 [Phaeosphaeria sp. MPI-PUGE-AT-0046c]